jgi:beta/gamma crystallin
MASKKSDSRAQLHELSPDNGCVVDTKWQVEPLSYHACATEVGTPHSLHDAPMPELVIYDHVGFKGAFARTNLSFHFLGDFWNDRISSLIIVSGVWRFYRDEYYKGDHWDLGPGFYECFFKDKGPDDVVSSFKAIKLT